MHFESAGKGFVLTHGGALPLRPQGVSSPLVNRTPKGRGAKAEINLAIVSDSLPLGTPSLGRRGAVEAQPRPRHRGEFRSYVFYEAELLVKSIAVWIN